MNLFHSIILGIVEGLTEFLPISSTAHLIIASKLLHLTQTSFQEFFEVFIQAGAIIAVFFMYLKLLLDKPIVQLKILLSFIPTAVVGLIFYKIIKGVFFKSNQIIAVAMFVVAVVFLITEYLIKKKKITLSKTISSMKWHDALLIGLGQSLAVVPGVSRAGIVIVCMMLMGYKRKEAATYSFLIAIPTILAAAFFDVYKVGPLLFLYANQAPFLVVGFLTSLLFAYLSVRWLIGYLKNHTLTPFALYRILLAIIILLVLAR